jgi:predicted permease
MKILAYFRSLYANWFHRSEIADDMDEELRSHIQLRADDLERSGLPRGEAERRARIEFGGQEKFKDECHEAMGGNFFETLAQDVRISLRVLRKSPGFLFAAVLTLALAIGANAVVFGVLNAFILRPLNVPHPESLYALWRPDPGDAHQSYPDYLDLRDRNHSFDGLVAFSMAGVGLDTGNGSSFAWVYDTSGNYFDTLGLHPYLGQFFHASDEHGPNSAPYVVLTYAFWHSHFHDDRNVIGHVVQVNKNPFTILGVAPPEFHGTILFFNPDFFVPLVNQEQIEGVNALNERKTRGIFMVMGQLKAGVTPAQASADLSSIGSYLGAAYPKDDPKLTFTLVRPGLYGDYLGGPVKAFLTGLMLLAGLILLAACANLGSLFAARAADRSREVALRLALGSSRQRIVRGLFTEAILISLLGGAFGLMGGIALLRGLSVWQPFPQWPIHMPMNPDAKVYAEALLLALASGFLFGAVPVRQVLRTNPYEVVKMGSGSRLGRRVTLRDVLLVVQIAICAVLVTSSMVALRGLVRSLHNDYGFDTQNTLLVSTDLSMAGYSGDRVPVMQKRMIDALQTIPGVESVGLSDAVPLAVGSADSMVFSDSMADLRPSNAAADASIFNISPDYFHAAGTALLSGRTFTLHDDKNSPRVAVVNREFARRLFNLESNALGGYYKMPDGTRVQVVGVAENGKYGSLTEDPQPAMFLPILQSPSSATELTVRSSHDPLQIAPAIKRTLQQLDAGLPFHIQTRIHAMDVVLFAPRMAVISLGVMGMMGAMLAITGIFGMAAYSVSKRLRELGIRVALGGRRKEVLHAALARSFQLLACGSAAGLLLGILASRVLAFIVYQATPRDPLVLTGVVLAMALVGLLATWVPARRALAVNPMRLLREE